MSRGHGTDRKPVSLSKGVARELARQATRVQRAFLNADQSDYRPRIQPRVVLKAIVATTITACSGSTPGAGTATIQYWDGSTITAGETVDVLNWFETYAPTAGLHIMIYWADNAYWLGPGDCP